MYQYRLFNEAGRYLRRLLIVGGLVLGFLLATETLRLFVMLYRRAPWAGYALLGVILLTLALLALRRHLHRRDHRILHASGLRLPRNPSHAELRRHTKYLIHVTKRMAGHRLLSDDQSARLRTCANELQEVLHHHPLIDDLRRAIDATYRNHIFPTFRYLDTVSAQIVRSKIRSSLQDLYQPPFPVIPAVVNLYHQITLLSELTDIYLANPSLREYLRVMSDVWQVATKGDFLRYGQRLYSGISANSYTPGRAGEDLGQAMSIVWMNATVARIAIHRVTTLHDWTVKEGIARMDQSLIACLEQTRDALVHDALPVLKKRILHYTPPGRDATTFVEEVSSNLVRSVESVVLALSTSDRILRPAEPERTAPVTGDESGHSDPAADDAPPHHTPTNPGGETVVVHRKRRRQRPKGPLHSLIQRLLYSRPS